MSGQQLDEWREVFLRYANGFKRSGDRTWFSVADILTNYLSALTEFNRSGTISSGVGRLVSNLPKQEGTNEIDQDKVEALRDLLISEGLLAAVPGRLFTDAMEITQEGQRYLAMRDLGLEETVPAANVPSISIITIREDEYRAFHQRLPGGAIAEREHRTYYSCHIDHQSGISIPVSLIRVPEQGPTAAQDTARDTIEDLAPSLIVLAGIAGGVPSSEFTLGDVLVASRLHDFTVGASKEGSLTTADQGGPMAKKIQDLAALLPGLDLSDWAASVGVARPTVNLAKSKFYGSPETQAETRRILKDHFSGPDARQAPIFTTGSIASSGLLVKDTQLLALWRQNARELSGIEMELSGVYAAAQRRDRTYPILAVRGISDIVGFQRSPAWTTYACHSAAAFCLTLLRSAPLSTL
jgi:nucleoside phosphorylase